LRRDRGEISPQAAPPITLPPQPMGESIRARSVRPSTANVLLLVAAEKIAQRAVALPSDAGRQRRRQDQHHRFRIQDIFMDLLTRS